MKVLTRELPAIDSENKRQGKMEEMKKALGTM